MLERAGLTNVDAEPVRSLVAANPQRLAIAGRLQRRLRYLQRPSAIYRAWRFKRLARRHPAYWAQQENYLFFAQKPSETTASARRDHG